jgi:hypothetical protein
VHVLINVSEALHHKSPSPRCNIIELTRCHFSASASSEPTHYIGVVTFRI